MKYILILLLLPVIGWSQPDSSRTKVSITIAAKTVQYISLFYEKGNKYEDIDSVSKKRFRVQSPPSGNNNVILDSIEGRVLLEIYNKLSEDVFTLSDTTKITKDFEAGCRNSGGVWLNKKIDNVKKDKKSVSDNRISAGDAYLRKQEN